MASEVGVLRRGLDMLRVVFVPTHLRRTLTIALLVGSWLTLVNQGDVILRSGWSPALLVKLGLNYLTPFVVANLGLLSRSRSAARHSGRAGQSGIDEVG